MDKNERAIMPVLADCWRRLTRAIKGAKKSLCDSRRVGLLWEILAKRYP